jgi:hypothetical protein
MVAWGWWPLMHADEHTSSLCCYRFGSCTEQGWPRCGQLRSQLYMRTCVSQYSALIACRAAATKSEGIKCFLSLLGSAQKDQLVACSCCLRTCPGLLCPCATSQGRAVVLLAGTTTCKGTGWCSPTCSLALLIGCSCFQLHFGLVYLCVGASRFGCCCTSGCASGSRVLKQQPISLPPGPP